MIDGGLMNDGRAGLESRQRPIDVSVRVHLS